MVARVIDIRGYFEGRDYYLNAPHFEEKEGDLLDRIVSFLPLDEDERMDIAYRLMCERKERKMRGW